jgi:hypothetical protein
MRLDGSGEYSFTDRDVRSGATYRYELGLIEADGIEVRIGQVMLRTLVQAEFALGRPYPNPTSIGFAVKVSNPTEGQVSLKVVDVHGRLVREVYGGFAQAGEMTLRWDGTNARGLKVGNGIYFVQFEAAGRRATQRITVMQ